MCHNRQIKQWNRIWVTLLKGVRKCYRLQLVAALKTIFFESNFFFLIKISSFFLDGLCLIRWSKCAHCSASAGFIEFRSSRFKQQVPLHCWALRFTISSLFILIATSGHCCKYGTASSVALRIFISILLAKGAGWEGGKRAVFCWALEAVTL